MFCNNCGYKCDSDSIYCEKCGHKLNTPAPKNYNKDFTTKIEIRDNKEPKNKLNYVLPIVFIILTVIVIFSLLIIISLFKEKNDSLLNEDHYDEIVGCDKTIYVDDNFQFGVILEENSSTSSVSVTDDENKTIDVNFISDFGMVFVTPPNSGYKENTLYHITLKNAKFTDVEYQDISNLCFKLKTPEEVIEEESFKLGTYTHEKNFLTLNTDNTFILSFLSNGEMLTYKGNYKIENYVITCTTTDSNGNYGVFTFNINAEGDITSKNKLGISEYSDEGTIYTYKG